MLPHRWITHVEKSYARFRGFFAVKEFDKGLVVVPKPGKA